MENINISSFKLNRIYTLVMHQITLITLYYETTYIRVHFRANTRFFGSRDKTGLPTYATTKKIGKKLITIVIFIQSQRNFAII